MKRILLLFVFASFFANAQNWKAHPKKPYSPTDSCLVWQDSTKKFYRIKCSEISGSATVDSIKVGRIEQGRGTAPIFMYFNGTSWVRNDTSYIPRSGASNITGNLKSNQSFFEMGLASGNNNVQFSDGVYTKFISSNGSNITGVLQSYSTGLGYSQVGVSNSTSGYSRVLTVNGSSTTTPDLSFKFDKGIAWYNGDYSAEMETSQNLIPSLKKVKQLISDSVGTAQSTTLADGKIWIGDGTNTAFPRALSGDVTINNLGEATVDSINGITKSYYDPRSSIQDQLDEKQDKLSNYYIVSTVSALQTYLSGLGSGVDVNIWFPFGTYNVTTPITISNKGIVNIKSEGATLTNSLSATGSVIAITTVTTCDIENLNIDMNLNTQTSAGITLNGLTGTSSFTRLNMYSFYDMDNKGLVLQDVSPGAPSNAGTVITDCNFYNIPLAGTFDYNNNTAKGIGVYMPSGAEYWKMDNCTFSALHVGVWLLNGANGLVNNCDFLNCNPYLSGTKYAALYIQDNASNIGKLTVTGCKFNHNWGYSFFSTTTTLSYPPIVITGCEFISNAISAMRMGPALTGAEVTANMFRTANLQSTALNSPYTDADCDYILLQSSKNIIQSNYFWKQSTYHYAVTSIGSADSNVVKNNYIDPTMGTVTMVGSANIVQLNGREGDFIKQGGNIQARFTNSLTGIGGLNVGGVDTTLQMMLGNIGHNNTNYIAKSKNTAGITFSYATNTPVITSYLNTGQTINGTATFTTQSRQWIGGNFSFGSGVNVLGTTATNTMFLKTGTSSTSGQSGHFSMNSATINGSDDCPHFWTADNMNVYLGKRFGMKSANDLNLATNNTVRMSIDSLTGHVGIGVVNATAKLQVSLSGQSLSSVSLPSSVAQTIDFHGNKILSVRNIVSNDTLSRRGLFAMAATGGTNNAMTAVANGRFLGSLIYAGHDGTSFVDGASISAIVNGTVSTGNLPTDIILNTTVSNVALERMRVTSTGNVGIGITSPTAKLHVSTNGQSLNSIFTSASVVDAILYSGTKRLIHRMVVSNDTALVRPLINFQRTGGSNTTPTSVTNGTYLGSISASAYDGTSLINGTDITSIVNGTVSTGVVPSDMVFSTTATNTLIERMRINSTGNVGIGITTPLCKLDVAGSNEGIHTSSTTADEGAWLRGSAFATSLSFNSTFNGTNSVAKGVSSTSFLLAAASHRWYVNSGLTIASSFTPTEIMRLNSTGLSVGTTYISTAAPSNGMIVEGNVGIGISSPSTKLHVVGDATLNGSIASPIQTYTSSTTGNVVISTITKTIVRMDVSVATQVVCGFSVEADGTIYILKVVGGNPVTFSHENSAAANPAERIYTDTGADVVVANNGTFRVLYDATTSKWRQF